MNAVQATLRVLIGQLEGVEIPYMVVGSLASSAHGMARTTYDADIVIDPTTAQLDVLIETCQRGFYVSPQTARQAFRVRTMFNVVDLNNGCKADLIFRKDNSFAISEFSRRRKIPLETGTEIWAATPEDTILSKLKWAQMGGSERQLQDATQIVAIQESNLDFDYLRKWGLELQVGELLEQVLKAAGRE